MAKWFWSGSVEIGTGGQLLVTGTGDPEGVVTAPIGSLYLRVDGAANHAVYIKESGAGPTGWTAIGGAGTSVTLRHNNSANSSQNNLNLVDGNGISISDNGGGAIQIDGATLLHDGALNSSQDVLDIRAGTGIVVTDNGLGRIAISVAASPVTIKIDGTFASGTNPINLTSGTGIVLTDEGAGVVSVNATPLGAPGADTTSKTTALLNAYVSGAFNSSNTESGFVNLDKSGMLLRVVVDRPARIRLYSTAALRDADLGRPVTIPPTPGTMHGVLVDLRLNGIDSALTWTLTPVVIYVNGDTVQTDKIYYNITNMDTGSSTVAVTFTTVQEQS